MSETIHPTGEQNPTNPTTPTTRARNHAAQLYVAVHALSGAEYDEYRALKAKDEHNQRQTIERIVYSVVLVAVTIANIWVMAHR